MKMSNSKLVDYKKISPNQSGKRNHTIDRITPHSIVGQMSVESLGAWFAKKSTEASSNYGIGYDGRVGLYVNEGDRSWCSSSGANDNRAVTIECACEPKYPYTFNQVVYRKLIDLCVDICRRNGKTKLIWLGDKDKTLDYKPKKHEMILTVHKWFGSTTCPNKWMLDHMDDLAAAVTAKLAVRYQIQVGAFKNKSNADRLVKTLAKHGFAASVIKDDSLYCVRYGSYKSKTKAEAGQDLLTNEGFKTIIVKG